GMVVRLAFALVTALQPEVLIIDEALAVGDQHFQKKCIERIQSFREAGCAILFCSHSMYHIRHLCDVAMWLDKGQVMAFGETEGVVSAYEAHSRAQDAATQALPAGTAGAAAPMAPVTAAVAPVAGAEIVSFEVASLSNDPVPLLLSPDLVVTMTARVPGDEVPNFSLMLEQLKGTGITVVGTHTDGVRPVRQADGLWRIRLTFPALPLNSGEYVLSPYLFDSSGLVVYEERLGYFPFRVEYPNIWPGLVRLPHHWDAGD
ncbi:MAG: ABC transporter ATP-binding protein, partial [Ottowia sp.]|nr:ABC transporter ATP-binding protein [Ottowia sp.]